MHVSVTLSFRVATIPVGFSENPLTVTSVDWDTATSPVLSGFLYVPSQVYEPVESRVRVSRERVLM